MRAWHYVFAAGFVWYVGSLRGLGRELAFGHFSKNSSGAEHWDRRIPDWAH